MPINSILSNFAPVMENIINQIKDIRIEEFDYPLPDSRIAKHPLELRDRCKLLVRAADGNITDHRFDELPDLLPADSILIYNNTRVINARLRFRKSQGAVIEVFCLEPSQPRDYAISFASTGPVSWQCFVGNSKRWKEGPLQASVGVDGKEITLTAVRKAKEGNTSIVEFSWDDEAVTFSQIISAAGEIPIPPYLNRSTEDTDSTDYQTVYSRIDGSVAAPTAGLHFTDEILAEIASRDIPRRQLTLHVGAGTFQPVKTESIGDHLMHSEFISVDRLLIEELAETDRKVIAVGTTSVRTLESLYHAGRLIASGAWDGEVPQWCPYSDELPAMNMKESLKALLDYLDAHKLDRFVASTRIIIAPGYKFHIVKGMITNFHQPQSTLLLLVSAFTDGDWKKMYDHALSSGYRFLSYGDASLLLS